MSSHENVLESMVADIELRDLSPSTRDSYRSMVEAFLWCVGKPVEDIDQADVRAFLLELKARGRSPSTRRCYQAAIGMLFRTTLRRPEVVDGIPVPKVPKKPPMVATRGELDGRGEAIVGLHSDFGWRFVRDEDAGQVAFVGAKLGWRQFAVHGLHVDVTLNAGYRHQVDNPWDGEPIHALQGRLWTFAGWQHEVTPTVYWNTRFGTGLHAFRTDRYAAEEKPLVLAGDLNLGLRFR